MQVEIMFLTWNRRGITARCFKSLIGTLLRPDVRWSVLDNGSTDGTAEWLLNLKKTLNDDSFTLYLGADNKGVSGGRDFLLKRADPNSDILLFADSDIIATEEDWLDNLIAVLEDKTIGIAGPGGHWVTTKKDGRWKWFKPVDPEFVGDCDTVSGYLQAFRREAIEGFEFDMFLNPYWHDDLDMCMWLRDKGYRVHCPGSLGVHHIYAGSGDDGRGNEKLEYIANKWAGKGLIREERDGKKKEGAADRKLRSGRNRIDERLQKPDDRGLQRVFDWLKGGKERGDQVYSDAIQQQRDKDST